ncbi:hypothetical protein [Actinophytocola glycyrrhizae]|uniref:Uncharacterized protein n=1 Tax=Actinophytocola glycyrrhizae TaxID=2044873 RepID=A0ABV9S928_9PSEU
MHDTPADPHRIAMDIRDEAFAALSVTRDNQVEITSVRQLRVLEDAARRILAMHLDDETVNDLARSMLDRVAAARRWTWVNVPAATMVTVAALAIACGASVLGGIGDNIVLAVAGGIAGSVLLGIVVLRYRRENWRIRAERIAPMIWHHGV